MTYLSAAIAVLTETRRAMTAREIAEAALAQGLIDPRGRTPDVTMKARLYCEARTEDSVIRREFVPGAGRAKRSSVRWSLGVID